MITYLSEHHSGLYSLQPALSLDDLEKDVKDRLALLLPHKLEKK
jgi:hypothetical protein